ncbi:amidohydrolase, partial [Seonamhaeicola marinus]
LDLAMERNILNQNEYDAIWQDNVLQWLCGDDTTAKQKLINRILN